MLTLSQLEVNGFKSFVDPVELSISKGITAVVGPNGCGKSNLSEAITWVLGEQSAKSLRGSRMEDVIFAGSAGRKPVGMAEVTLTLEADAGFPRAEDGKVTIGRRVFRSGQSNYRLNGKTVRLKEIKDLLMDTGLGIRAYSVIEQGKIGMILSGKPQERRKLLEEAAGITRYKARKRIAEIKLEEATANLLRLDDIISEVERRLRSLKRQAGAARRYKKRHAHYQALHDQLLRGRWFLLAQRLEAQELQIAAFTRSDAEATASLTRDEAALAAGREDLDRRASALAAQHESAANLLASIEGRQTFLEGARGTLRDIAERLERGDRQSEERQRAVGDLRGTVGQLDERTAQLASSRDQAAKQVAADDAELLEAQQAVAEAQQRQESHRQALLSAVGAVNRFKSALQQQAVEIERRSLRGRFLADEAARVGSQVAEAEDALKRMAEALGEVESELESVTAERHAKSRALDDLLDEESKLGDAKRAHESRLGELEQRRRILEDLGRKAEEHRRRLATTLESVGIEDPQFLATHLRTAAGWEQGVDAFLGALTDAVVVAGEVDLVEVAKRLSAADASGSLVAWRGDAATPAPAATVDDPDVVMSLSEALALPAELSGTLPPAYLVASIQDAARLAAEHPGVAFISRDRLWAQGGVLHVQSEQAAPGELARERELEEIRAAIPEAEIEVERLTAALTDARTARTELAGRVQKLEERIAELRRESAVGQARRQDGDARRAKLAAQLESIEIEQKEIQTQLDDAAKRHRDLGSEVAAAEKAHAESDAALAAAQVSVDQSKEIRESLSTAGAGRRARLELLDERLESHHEECARVRRQTAEAERQVALWQRERDALVARAAETEAEIAEAEKALQSALEDRATAQDAVLAAQAELDGKREALRALETGVAEIRESRDGTRGDLETARVAQARLRQDAEHLVSNFWESFGKLLPGAEIPAAALESLADADADAEADADAGVENDADAEIEAEAVEIVDGEAEDADGVADPDADEPDEPAETVALAEDETGDEAEDETDSLDPLARLEVVEVEAISAEDLAAIETEHSAAKSAVERMGPVNVLAADEYEENEERHTFLSQQRSDVATSVKSLKETIAEINVTSSERFKETFAQVNETFGKTFEKLFSGGEAEMRLMDEEDLLESGIEIVARPPGKRAQNIMLLSGGEKALAAIALLFALFQTKPSPFCILDEVDAPLDDANVLRFVDMLRGMDDGTQFIVITHNKLTMEAASTLYGVTMEEKGVSKVVAVEMDDVEPVAEAAGAA